MKGRQKYGADKEMKAGIAYDGILKEKCKDGFRSTLDNKTAFASFENASEFEVHKEGVIASVYDMSKVKLRIRNGDEANWIQKPKGFECLCVLDAYHRNNKISRCVKNSETAEHIDRKIEQLLVYLAECVQSCEEESEKEKLKELLSYSINTISKSDLSCQTWKYGKQHLYCYRKAHKRRQSLLEHSGRKSSGNITVCLSYR